MSLCSRWRTPQEGHDRIKQGSYLVLAMRDEQTAGHAVKYTLHADKMWSVGLVCLVKKVLSTCVHFCGIVLFVSGNLCCVHSRMKLMLCCCLKLSCKRHESKQRGIMTCLYASAYHT